MPHSSWGQPGLSRTVKIAVPGGGIQLNVHPELEIIFEHLVARLNAARIRHGKRPLTSSGGYNKRKIANTDRWSNHSWGLAGDFDAATNPYARNGTTDFPVEETRRICRELGFRWGWDYSGKKDAMHFEYMGSREDAAELTRRLKAPLVKTPAAPAAPTVQEDDMSAEQVQNILNAVADVARVATEAKNGVSAIVGLKLNEQVAAVEARTAAKLDAVVALVASDRDTDPDELKKLVQDAARAGADAALSERISDARVDLTVQEG